MEAALCPVNGIQACDFKTTEVQKMYLSDGSEREGSKSVHLEEEKTSAPECITIRGELQL